MHREIIIKVLTNIPIFKDISKESIAKLAGMARFNQYLEGVTVFAEGDPGDCLYIIASGKVDLYTRKISGDMVKIKTLGVAEVFGEMALLDGLPRSATALVCEKAILFYIYRTDFNFFLVQNPDVALKIIETISRRLRDNNKKLVEISGENDDLKAALREAYTLTGRGEKAQASGDDRLYPEDYVCPCCSSLVNPLKKKNR